MNANKLLEQDRVIFQKEGMPPLQGEITQAFTEEFDLPVFIVRCGGSELVAFADELTRCDLVAEAPDTADRLNRQHREEELVLH